MHKKKNRPMQSPALPNTPQIQINVEGKTPHRCYQCGGTTFRPAIQLYVVPAAESPNNREIVAQEQVLMCCICSQAFKREPMRDPLLMPDDDPAREWAEEAP